MRDPLDPRCYRRMAVVTLFVTTFFLLTSPLSAQLGGENIRGDLGLKSGSQAPPGMYIGDLFYYYRTGEVRFANGVSLSGPDLNIFANVFLFNYVTKKKLLGGNYGFMVAPAILSSKLALPRLDIGGQTWGLADLYIQPIQLGWTLKHADAFVGYAFYAPVGRFTAGADNNTGLGMWSNEFSGGTTVFFDPGKKWHASAAGFYEIHSSKRDEDLKIGDLFTLEGGVGRSFLQGYANAGLAYYGQWKVTEDSGRDVSPLVAGRKGSMVGLGPELNMPFGHHPVFLTFRYLFDVRSRLATQGQSAIFSLVYVRPAAAPPAPAANCLAQPLEALAGEPVTVTANATNFEPKHPLTYQWNSTLGKVSGKSNTATIDTIGVVGGSYTASARITDPKVKNAGAVSCTVSFIVKELPKNPPTTSWYADASSLQSGGTASIPGDCKCPDSAQVRVARWNATRSNLSASGSTTNLNTADVSSGSITVNATCADIRELTIAASTPSKVEAVRPSPPQASNLSKCSSPNQAEPMWNDPTQ